MKYFLQIISSFLVGIHTAFIEMGKHKLRSSLSMLGVMLGVAALVAMLTLIGGIDVFLTEKMGRWAGSLWIWKSWDDPPEGKIAASRSPGMHLTDSDYLGADSSSVGKVFRTIERRDRTVLIDGQKLWWIRMHGTDATTLADDCTDIEVGSGRAITDEEFFDGAKVCLISWDIYKKLAEQIGFDAHDTATVLGHDVSFRDIRFRIIGVLAPKDRDTEPWTLRWTVVVPLEAMRKFVTGRNPDPGSINVSVKDPTQLAVQSKAVARALSSRHRGVTDFEYRGADWADNIKTTLTNVSMVMGIISIVSLLVGGLGIMNVMLSSISERIKEIGVRKALGAQDLQIFVQFLAETTTLSCTGGIIGAVIGLLPIVFADAIKKGSGGAIVPTILPLHVIFVFVVVVSVGIVFGLYPAVKASRMNPIDALRYE